MDHQQYMRLALLEADKALALGEVPVGAVVVREDRVLALAHNRRETWQDPTAHAEVLALRQAARELANWRLAECTLYVTLEPCAMCAGALVLARLKTLVYGATDPKAGAVDSHLQVTEYPGFNHRVWVVPGVLEEECREIIQRFFRHKRK